MSDAATVRCPSCGAPAEPAAHRCVFCRTRLARVSCASCFALMFDEATHCAACGAQRARADRSPADARCPGCGSQLQALQIGPLALLECGACDGIWVDADVFERVCADTAAQTAVVHRYPDRRPVEQDRVQYRPCVRCGTLMNRVNFGRLSGTIVDVCKGHGTFLDSGELHRIVAFIRGGGLDRARARQVEELRHREQKLRSAEARLARTRGQAAPARTASWSAWRFMVGGRRHDG